MKQAIATIGFRIPCDDVTFVPLDSDASLLDYDIAIFSPNFRPFLSEAYLFEWYLGKPCFYDNTSFQICESKNHWCTELSALRNSGRSIFVVLDAVEEVYVATGERETSGTGRNQKTTRIVRAFSNMELLPFDLKARTSTGRSMCLSQSGSLLSSYWSEFGADSEYRVLISCSDCESLVVTNRGRQTVGCRLKQADAIGQVFLLPYFEFCRAGFQVKRRGEYYWTREGLARGTRFVQAIIEIDRAARKSKQVTPTPTWVLNSNEFELPAESKINENLLLIESKIARLNERKNKLIAELTNARGLKRLLFEKGPPLEEAVISALRLLGFKAEPFDDGSSEFDVVFSSREGRFIGEVEGKDSKAINIDKFRQLETNIQEDFQRDETEEIAQGALFGNAFRFIPPEERGDWFTNKCLMAAKRADISLVRTTDLFRVAKYLSGKRSAAFAKKCRVAILKSSGFVEFPPIPHAGAKNVLEEK